MRRTILVAALVALAGGATAAPLSTADCSRIAAQVDGYEATGDLDVPRLIQDGSPDVAAAARRFEALRSEVPQPRAALVNAVQDLRYQLQVCARR